MAEDRRRPPKFSTETRKSDPRRTNDENFASFMGFLDERFYDVDRHACRVKKGVRLVHVLASPRAVRSGASCGV